MSAEVVQPPVGLQPVLPETVREHLLFTGELAVPTLEAGAYMVGDQAVINEARRLTARTYLKKGFISAYEIGPDGTILPEFDPYIASSDYYIVANNESQIVATTRKIKFDPIKGQGSFPVWRHKEVFDQEAVQEIETIGLENCVEISALSKEPGLDNDNKAALRIYRSIIQDALKKNGTTEQELVFVMAVSPKLFEQLTVLFNGGVKRIGPNLDYPGEEAIPAMFKPVEGLVNLIKSSTDPENPNAELNSFFTGYVLDGLSQEAAGPHIIEALNNSGLSHLAEKMPQDKRTETVLDNYSDQSVVDIEEVESDNSEDLVEKSTLAQKLKVGAVVGAGLMALAFQQSPGNEALRTMAALNVLDSTQNAAMVAGAVGALTMAIEGGTSTLIALGLHQEQGVMKRIIERFRKRNAKKEDTLDSDAEAKRSLISKAADIGVTVSIGPGIAMAKRHLQEREPTLRKDISRGLGYSALGSVVSGGIGYLMAGGIQHAEKVGLEKQAELVVTYATQWKFWAGVVGGMYAYNWLQQKARQTFKRNTN